MIISRLTKGRVINRRFREGSVQGGIHPQFFLNEGDISELHKIDNLDSRCRTLWGIACEMTCDLSAIRKA